MAKEFSVLRLTLSRFCLTLMFANVLSHAGGQMRIVSLGMFTGVTSTYTWDEGINLDQRYNPRYDLKLAPIGFNYGVDYNGFGFIISPGLFKIGQNYHVINTVGGQEGLRKINLNYLNVPLALKFHLIDLTFLKTSFILGASAAYLLNGHETITHNNAKLKFPAVVYPILPSDYIVEYDGVLVPKVKKLEILQRKDFNPIQVFGLMGIRSDWYFSEKWKVSFDFRVNYTMFDNRSDAYLKKLSNYQTMYDIPGKRRDIVGLITVGVSRYIELEKKETKETKKRTKGSSKQFKPTRNPWPGPRKSKPKH